MSYLADKKQCTKYKNRESDMLGMPIGLLQGTQLSVFLFSLYVNDVAEMDEERENKTFRQ